MEFPLKNKLAVALLPIAGVAHRAAIIPTASRRLIRPERNFAEDISFKMPFCNKNSSNYLAANEIIS
jgi:hypothetical protein